MEQINVTRSFLPPLEEYVNEISSLWDSRWLTNRGEKHLALERALAEYLKTPYISLFANGHMALEAGVAALGLRGEAITTPFTYSSTVNALVRNGIRPVFCDVRPDDFTLDVEQIARHITPRTCAIVPVHVYGNLCRVQEIAALAKQHGLRVLYDAAHAFGESLEGTPVARFGDASMFSLHATKVLHTVEGGALCFGDAALARRLEQWKSFGIERYGADWLVGGNAKMSEFHAAMGLCNLRHVDEIIEKRKRVIGWYQARLQDVPQLTIWRAQPGVESNYIYFPVMLGRARDAVYEALAAENIFSRKYFFPLVSELYACDPEETPVAAAAARGALCLPMSTELTEAQVDRICSVLRAAVRRFYQAG